MTRATHLPSATRHADAVCAIVGHARKDKKLAKTLARALEKRIGSEVRLARSDAKTADVDDAKAIAEADLLVALWSENARGAHGVEQQIEHALECSVPVLIAARVKPPAELAASAHVVRIGKKPSDIEQQLDALDVHDLLTSERALGAPLLADDTQPSPPIENAPTARVVAIVHRSHSGDDGLLLLRRPRATSDGRWCLPGGDVLHYESSQEAVRRVVREITSLDFDPSFLSYFDEILPRDDIHRVNLAFVGPGSGEVAVDADRVEEVAWHPVLDALALDLAPTARDVLQAFAEGV